MSVRASLDFGIFAAIVVAIFIVGTCGHASAQTTCPPGQSNATAADIPLMQAAGIPNPSIGECWSASNSDIGQATAQAKQDLTAMSCNSGVNITGLDPKFAVCADTLMKDLRASDPTACVLSAYRSAALQLQTCEAMCHAASCPGTCAAPGTSYHQRGLAIDVKTRDSAQMLWNIAAQVGGLGNPTSLHQSDPFHIQATTQNCSDSNFVPSNTDSYTPSASAVAPSLSSTLQNPLLSTQPSAVSNPFTTPLVTQSTAPSCTPQYFCSNNSVYYESSACVTQVFQQCQYGCSNNACAAAPASTSTTQQSSSNTSLITTAPIATSTSIVSNEQFSQELQGGTGSQGTTQIITTIATGSGYVPDEQYGQTTFSDEDQNGGATQSLSPLQQVLAGLRSVLESLLGFLNPSQTQ